MTAPKRVQIAKAEPDQYGRLAFRDLLDDGGSVLRFRSGGGFVSRDTIEARRWVVEPLDDQPGWEERQGWPGAWKGTDQ